MPTKPLNLYATSGFAERMQDYMGLFLPLGHSIFNKDKHDMYVFNVDADNVLTVRRAGYSFLTDKLDESTIVHREHSPIDNQSFNTFWLKIDDYGKNYVGTFLFPEEY